MKHFLLIVILTSTLVSYASEFRSFTSKDGRAINAKILKVNKATQKVTLLKENRKQVSVPINIFSEKDRTYINSWSPFPSQNQEPEKNSVLSEDKLEAIADQYAEACEAKDMEALKPLFNNWAEELLSSTRPSLHFTKKVRVNGVEGNICEVKVQESGNNSFGGYGYLQFLPTGKIKYDAILIKHPIYDAFFSYEQVICEINSTQYDIRHLRDDIAELKETGIPLFGLRAEQPRHEQLKSLDRIKDWLLEEGETWDVTEPKLPCPPEIFKKYTKRHK